jgi:hypothetical protein
MHLGVKGYEHEQTTKSDIAYNHQFSVGNAAERNTSIFTILCETTGYFTLFKVYNV